VFVRVHVYVAHTTLQKGFLLHGGPVNIDMFMHSLVE
jgi:hypothetical protein